MKEKEYLRRTKDVLNMTLSGFFPISFTYDVSVRGDNEWQNKYRFRDVRVNCSLLTGDSVKNEYSVPEDSQKPIIIPGLTILDVFRLDTYSRQAVFFTYVCS